MLIGVATRSFIPEEVLRFCGVQANGGEVLLGYPHVACFVAFLRGTAPTIGPSCQAITFITVSLWDRRLS